MSQPIDDQLDQLILAALRRGISPEDVFQILMSKAQQLSQAGPIVQAVLDARATNGGQHL